MTLPYFTGRLASLNAPSAPSASGESEIARRARDLVDGTHTPGQFDGDAVDREMQRRRRDGHYARSNHSPSSGWEQRRDELPNGAEGSAVTSKVEAPKPPRPLDFDDHREALIAKLQKEMRSSSYIEAALEVHDQTWRGLERQAAEKAGRGVAVDHHKASTEWHESNRTDSSNESAVARARRENEESLRSAWQSPPVGIDSERLDDSDANESPVAQARRENENAMRNAWRNPA